MNITELANKAATSTGKVMIEWNHKIGRRHLKLYRDEEGPYVRVGRRGSQHKARLSSARICCKEPLVAVFKISSGQSN